MSLCRTPSLKASTSCYFTFAFLNLSVRKKQREREREREKEELLRSHQFPLQTLTQQVHSSN